MRLLPAALLAAKVVAGSLWAALAMMGAVEAVRVLASDPRAIPAALSCVAVALHAARRIRDRDHVDHDHC